MHFLEGNSDVFMKRTTLSSNYKKLIKIVFLALSFRFQDEHVRCVEDLFEV